MMAATHRQHVVVVGSYYERHYIPRFLSQLIDNHDLIQESKTPLSSFVLPYVALETTSHKKVYIFGVHRQQDWDVLTEICHPLALILLVSSRIPEMFRETVSILETVHNQDVHMLIIAHSHTTPDAWDESDLRQGLKLGERDRLILSDFDTRQEAIRLVELLLHQLKD